MKQRIGPIVLPGPELVVKAIEGFETPVVLRIVGSYRHGSDFRYEFEFHALEAGQFNLVDFLERKDGSEMGKIPPVPVSVTSVLPEGSLAGMETEPSPLPRMGGYRTLVWWVAALWVIGLAVILFYRRWDLGTESDSDSEPGFAGKLRPRVEAAMAGTLDEEGRAELERMLLSYWRRRLDLQEFDAGEAMQVLRQHEDAGPLFRALEDWLHRPDPPEEVALDTLLEPYRHLEEGSG